MVSDSVYNQPNSQFIIYQTEDGQIRLEVWLEDETVWLSPNLMAELFQSSKQNISLHLKNIFDEQELVEETVVKNFLTTVSDGKKYTTRFYNLDCIISVGYRVKSHIATRFRQWATAQLRKYNELKDDSVIRKFRITAVSGNRSWPSSSKALHGMARKKCIK